MIQFGKLVSADGSLQHEGEAKFRYLHSGSLPDI